MRDTSGPLRFVINSNDDRAHIFDVVIRALDSVEHAATVFDHGGVWVGKIREQDGARQVQVGDEITISRPPTGEYDHIAINPDWILYEDDDLIALDKPAGTYVDATPWDLTGNLRVALNDFLVKRDGIQRQLHLAHRLDRDTSGVLLFSKNPEINPALQKVFSRGLAGKAYVCRCTGQPAEDCFDIATGHGRSAQGFFRVYPLEHIGTALPGSGGNIKLMQTRFEVIRRDNDSALVQAFPLTGRTHQIRLHMAHIGHALLGDTKYGGPAAWRGTMLSHHLLHASRLEIPHPRTRESLIINAGPVPWADVE